MISWWYALQRRIDLLILWPSCKNCARDLDHAKAAFMLHCSMDPAWLSLGQAETMLRIDKLE